MGQKKLLSTLIGLALANGISSLLAEDPKPSNTFVFSTPERDYPQSFYAGRVYQEDLSLSKGKPVLDVKDILPLISQNGSNLKEDEEYLIFSIPRIIVRKDESEDKVFDFVFVRNTNPTREQLKETLKEYNSPNSEVMWFHLFNFKRTNTTNINLTEPFFRDGITVTNIATPSQATTSNGPDKALVK
jgi:hypothetical protein